MRRAWRMWRPEPGSASARCTTTSKTAPASSTRCSSLGAPPWCDTLDAVLKSADGRPFGEQLEAVLHSLLAHFEAHRPFLSIVMQGEHAQDASVFPASRRPRETMQAVYLRLSALVERGLSQGALREQTGDLYAALLMGMVRSVLIRTLYETESTGPLTERAAELTHFFMHGASKKS